MKKKCLFIILICIILTPNIVTAHPGRTDSQGCHTCRTNCSKWGLSNGEYHCHNGKTPNKNNSSKNNSSNNSKTTKKTEPKVIKSTDNTLKSITINEKDFSTFDNIQYETYEDSVEIKALPNDSKATVKINSKELELGINTITIEVTSESGSTKTYNLEITKLKLSNNTNIKIFIRDEEINFIDNKASIEVEHNIEKLDYHYKLEDPKSNIEIKGTPELQEGTNFLEFIVTAEDGTTNSYMLIVYKEKEPIKKESSEPKLDVMEDKTNDNNSFLPIVIGSILFFLTGTLTIIGLKLTGKI